MEKKFNITHCFTDRGSEGLYTPGRGYGFVTGKNRAEIPCLRVPETNSGFLPQWWHGDNALTMIETCPEGVKCSAANQDTKREAQGRLLALCFRQDVPKSGSYRVTVTLSAVSEVREALLFAGRRRLVWRGSMKAGDVLTIPALCDVSPIVPRGQTEPVSDPSISIAILCGADEGVCLNALKVEEAESRTVYIMGDSTVTDQTANLPYAPGTSFSGWGQMIGAFLPEPLCISNHAHSGLTTESFTSGGHWDVMRPLMKKGDVCLMQFGHNDQKLPHLKAREGYTQRLKGYIGELRKAGVQPVLVTPLARNSWNSAGKYNDLLKDYAGAVLELGQTEGVPVIDLHRYALELICSKGLEGAKRWFYPGDFTHTNDFGAYRMASFAAQRLCAILGTAPKAMPDWECHEPFDVLEPPPDCPLTPPAGGRPNPAAKLLEDRPDDMLTRVEALELVIQLMCFFPINVYNDLYTDVVGHEAYAGTVQCAAQNGLIPGEWTVDGFLHPNRQVTAADFFAVLIPGYASRHTLGNPMPVSDNVPAFAQEAVGLAMRIGLAAGGEAWGEGLSRRQAAEICQRIPLH